MKIKLIPVAAAAEPAQFKGAVAVVFDVLRATSTIVTALASGYRKVYPVVNTKEAVLLAGHRGHALAGERGGRKMPGFSLGNSPLEFSTGPVAGMDTLVLTTSNGTGAIRKARSARKVLVGSIINARSTARAAFKEGGDILLVCAGSGGRYSLDDVLGAGFVLMEMVNIQGAELEMDDQALAALCLARYFRPSPLEGLMTAGHGQELARLGFDKDLRWCARLNMYHVAPVFNGEYVYLTGE